MRDTWGPPATDDGWPTFDEKGKRILERAFGPEEDAKASVDKGVRELISLLRPAPDDLDPAHEYVYAELGGEA